MPRKRSCVVCGSSFTPRSGAHKFCSVECKGKWKYKTGFGSTENQYKEISGNWKRYVSRLLYSDGRKRDGLTREIVMEKLDEQNFKCALSGVPLTCLLSKGKNFPTNVSIDRIEAGGTYTKENIQLVCVALNRWRSDLSVEDFINWCRKVVDYAEEKKSKELPS